MTSQIYPDGTPLAPGDSLEDNPQGGWEWDLETPCLLVRRSDTGTYEIPGAAEEEEWDDVRQAYDSVEDYGPLKGWGKWTRVYRVGDDEGFGWWYFVAEAAR